MKIKQGIAGFLTVIAVYGSLETIEIILGKHIAMAIALIMLVGILCLVGYLALES